MPIIVGMTPHGCCIKCLSDKLGEGKNLAKFKELTRLEVKKPSFRSNIQSSSLKAPFDLQPIIRHSFCLL